MKQDEIIARVRRKLAELAPALRAESLDPEAPLYESGAFDSIALVQTALFLETEFGVRVKAADLTGAAFRSLGDIARLVESRVKTH
jgi:acyl carrier protein